MTRAAACAAGVARTSGCWRVELVAAMPRVDCPRCGVVVASVPWAEPGSRFTRDFECFASMFVRQVRQCFSVVWADGFPRCRHRFPVM